MWKGDEIDGDERKRKAYKKVIATLL